MAQAITTTITKKRRAPKKKVATVKNLRTAEPIALITLDATGQSLGRIASEVASLLRGKDLATFAPNKIPSRTIVITNTDAMVLTGTKAVTKLYHHYTGYPGGIRTALLKTLFEKDSSDVLRRAVYGMLAPNKLRKLMLKQLIIHKSAMPIA